MNFQPIQSVKTVNECPTNPEC